MKKKLFLILGNQLFNPQYFMEFKSDHIFFMCEDYHLCSYEKHHKHKILLFLSSMRSFKDELDANKFEVIYKKINEKSFKIQYLEKLVSELENLKVKEVSMFEIEDKPFEKIILDGLVNFKVNYINSPSFLNKREEFKTYLSNSKKPFMANFYKIQRIKHNLLIDDDNKPVGGKWSFDSENRKKLPKNIEIPENIIFKETFHTKELKNEVNQKFTENPGDTGDFWLGTTRKNAQQSLDHFIKFKLNLFGDYEDAVDQRNNILFHSALSPYINLGLITPSEILLKLKSISKETSINSLEGYIRQVVGWREFIRGIYQNYSEELESKNFFNNKRKMKDSWYSGNTGIPPLDYSIKNALKYGWSHHIERLMILSNIMNLSGINPKEVYRWFMEMFVDSSEWVMTPNVYGMGLFSDGGIFATKPYICGSAYFLKMMDFKKGDWCHTMDGLYWNFINKNRNFFLKNPRLSMMVRILDKMSKERKDKIFKAANEFIDTNTED